MNSSCRLLLSAVAVTAAAAMSGPASSAGAAPEKASCAALGTYSIVQNGSNYAASAPPAGFTPLVAGGTATMSAYAGCGKPTVLRLSTDGIGAQLRHPVTAAIGTRLRLSGDLLLHFTGTAHLAAGAQVGALASQGPQPVLVSGVATYARVTTKGTLHGTRQLAFSVKTITVANVSGQLRVASDFGGMFSLSIALPGPAVGKIPSSFAYFALGAKTPAKLKAVKKPDPKL